MGSFSVFIDPQGRRWQFKTGYDIQDEYREGDAVPFHKNEAMALDIRWEDDVHDAVLEGAGNEEAWVIVKNGHVLPLQLRTSEDPPWLQRLDLMAQYGISEPKLGDWEAEAIIAYHEKEIASQRAWIARRDELAKKYGEGWHRKPNAHMVLTLNEEGFLRKILPPKEAVE